MNTLVKEPLWTRDFVLICIYNLIVFISFQMLTPTIPLYVDQLGGNETIVGVVSGFFAISSVVVRPWVGQGLDRYGRLGIWLVGAAIFFLTNFGYAWALSIPLLIGFRVIHGVGWGVVTTSAATAATDLIPAPRRGEGMGFFGLGTNIAMATGPLLGFFIAGRLGFNILFWGAGLLAFIAFLVITIIKLPKVTAVKGGPAPSLWEPTAIRPSLYLFFATFVYGGIVTFIALYALQVGIANAGIFFTAYAVTLIFTRPVAGMLFDRHGHKLVIVPGFIFLGLSLIVLSLTSNLALFILSAITCGIGFGALHPALQALSVAKCAPNRRGAAQACFTASFDLGIGSGSIVLGVLAQYVGYSMMYLVSSIMVIIGLMVYLYMGIPSEEGEVALQRER